MENLLQARISIRNTRLSRLLILNLFLVLSFNLNGQQIFWSEGGSVFKANTDGTCATSLPLPETIIYLSINFDADNNKMYLLNRNDGNDITEIIKANLDGTNSEVVIPNAVLQDKKPNDFTLDLTNNKIYWTQSSTNDSKIRRANLDGTNVEDFLTPTEVPQMSRPYGIDLDINNSHVYWSDEVGQALWRANFDGTGATRLTTLDKQPSGLDLDLTNNKIYWTVINGGNLIRRASLDGNDIETVIDTGDPFQVAVCGKSNKIYWTNSSTEGNNIKSADLNGSNPSTVTTAMFSAPNAIAVCKNCPTLCCITDIMASTTPSCDGNDAKFKVSFKALGGTGNFQILDGMTQIGTGSSSPIDVTLNGPTTAESKSLTVRYINDNTCSGTGNVSVPQCPPPCSITAMASAPTCEGNNATFNVSFTATNSAGGMVEVVENTHGSSSTVLGSSATSPIKVTISGPTSTSSKTYLVRFVNDKDCNTTVNVSLPQCPPPCSITASANTPTCEGNNVTFNVNFTATNSQGGTVEVVESGTATVLGSGTTSPIKVTVAGPTAANNKTYTVRFANEPTCKTSINVALPSCPIPSYGSFNRITFNDPCACDDPRNCGASNSYYFHDTLRIPATGTMASGLDIRINSSSNFFIAVPCFGGALTTPINGSSGTRIQETPTGSGIYKIEFWRPSGLQPALSVIENSVITTAPPTTFQPICTFEVCNPPAPPIPTMSEWGILIFGLLILNLGVYFVLRGALVY